MTALAKTSKGFGLTGTLMAHSLVLFAFLALADPAAPTLLPPPVEAVRISLTEPVAAPEPERPAQPETPPASEPPPLPLVEEATPVLKKKDPPPKKTEPRTQTVRPREQAKPVAGPERSPTSQNAAAPSPALKEARQTLLSALIARIEKEKRYPTSARRLGLQGQVTAEVRVDAQGRIIAVRVKGGGIHAILEKATMETLNRVQDKWKPVPVPEAMTLHIPIRYTLS